MRCRWNLLPLSIGRGTATRWRGVPPEAAGRGTPAGLWLAAASTLRVPLRRDVAGQERGITLAQRAGELARLAVTAAVLGL
jgi:hypothetical protein